LVGRRPSNGSVSDRSDKQPRRRFAWTAGLPSRSCSLTTWSGIAPRSTKLRQTILGPAGIEKDAGKQFRRVNGHLHLPALRAALERQVASETVSASRHT